MGSFNSNIRNWDVGNVVKMRKLLAGATSFNQNLCWDMSNVVDMEKMLHGTQGTILEYPECRTRTKKLKIKGELVKSRFSKSTKRPGFTSSKTPKMFKKSSRVI